MSKSIIDKIKLILFAILCATVSGLGVFLIINEIVKIGAMGGHKSILLKILLAPSRLYLLFFKSANVTNLPLIQGITYLILSFLVFGIPLIVLTIKAFLKRNEPVETENRYIKIFKLSIIFFVITAFNTLIGIYGLFAISHNFYPLIYKAIKFCIGFNSLASMTFFFGSVINLIKNKPTQYQSNYTTYSLTLLTVFNLLLFVFLIITPIVLKNSSYKNFIKILENNPKLMQKIKNDLIP